MCFCATPSIWDRSRQGPSYLVLRISKGILLARQRTRSVFFARFVLFYPPHILLNYVDTLLFLQAKATGVAGCCACLYPATCCRRNSPHSSKACSEGWWDWFLSRQTSRGIRIIIPSCPSHSFAPHNKKKAPLDGTW